MLLSTESASHQINFITSPFEHLNTLPIPIPVFWFATYYNKERKQNCLISRALTLPMVCKAAWDKPSASLLVPFSAKLDR